MMFLASFARKNSIIFLVKEYVISHFLVTAVQWVLLSMKRVIFLNCQLSCCIAAHNQFKRTNAILSKCDIIYHFNINIVLIHVLCSYYDYNVSYFVLFLQECIIDTILILLVLHKRATKKNQCKNINSSYRNEIHYMPNIG